MCKDKQKLNKVRPFVYINPSCHFQRSHRNGSKTKPACIFPLPQISNNANNRTLNFVERDFLKSEVRERRLLKVKAARFNN